MYNFLDLNEENVKMWQQKIDDKYMHTLFYKQPVMPKQLPIIGIASMNNYSKIEIKNKKKTIEANNPI